MTPVVDSRRQGGWMPILGVLATVLLALQFVPLGANYPSLQALVPDSATGQRRDPVGGRYAKASPQSI